MPTGKLDYFVLVRRDYDAMNYTIGPFRSMAMAKKVSEAERKYVSQFEDKYTFSIFDKKREHEG